MLGDYEHSWTPCSAIDPPQLSVETPQVPTAATNGGSDALTPRAVTARLPALGAPTETR